MASAAIQALLTNGIIARSRQLSEQRRHRHLNGGLHHVGFVAVGTFTISKPPAMILNSVSASLDMAFAFRNWPPSRNWMGQNRLLVCLISIFSFFCILLCINRFRCASLFKIINGRYLKLNTGEQRYITKGYRHVQLVTGTNGYNSCKS
jgi:hypothetical protein